MTEGRMGSLRATHDDHPLSIQSRFQALHSGDGYGVFLKHTTHSSFEITTEARVKYRTKLYTINSELDFKERKRLSVELHIDQ